MSTLFPLKCPCSTSPHPGAGRSWDLMYLRLLQSLTFPTSLAFPPAPGLVNDCHRPPQTFLISSLCSLYPASLISTSPHMPIFLGQVDLSSSVKAYPDRAFTFFTSLTRSDLFTAYFHKPLRLLHNICSY